MSAKRRLGMFGFVIGVLGAAALLGGAGPVAADTTPTACPGNGKTICVSITDQARASWTTDAANNPHYLTDFVTISNGDLTPEGTGTANLTNITLTITWADVGATTTSQYVQAASDARCTAVANTSFTLSCTAPKSLGPGESATFGPLIFRTATNVAATATNLHAVATAKEQAVAKQGKNPPIASVFTDNPTPYEASVDDDVSWAGGGANGISVTLATSSQVGNQFSRLPLPKTMPAGFATLTETDCPSGSTTCIGQQVSTVAVGLSPLNLQITYVGQIPSGLTESSLVVLHTRSGDSSPTTIDQVCTGAALGNLFSGVAPDNIPCRRVKITRGVAPGGVARVEIDAWDVRNGDWTWR
jgi:hypothetical protein